MKDYISLRGDWQYIQGACDFTTYNSTIVFASSSTGRTISGNQTFNNVSIYATGGTYINTPTNDTLTVAGTLSFEGNNLLKIETGVISAKGNINLSNTYNSTSSSGVGTILINGTSNQIFTGNSNEGYGRLCDIKIKKTSGTLILKDIISIQGNWTFIQGAIDASTYNSTIAFVGNVVSGVARTLGGTYSLYNVSFNGTGSTSYNNTGTSDTLTVMGDLKISGASAVNFSSGTIKAHGNITITNTSTSITSSTGTCKICGTTNQIFTGSGTVLAGKICNIIVDKPSDTLKLSSLITYLGDWKYIRGVVNPGTSTVVAYNAATVSGANGAAYMTFNNFRIYNNTTTLNSALIVAKDLTISSGATLNGNSKTIYVGGNWDNTGTFTYANTTVIFAGSTALGSANQRIIKSSGTVNFNILEINKPNGKVYLNCPTQVNYRLSMKKGILVSTATNLFSIPNGFSADTTYEGSDTSYVSGPMKKTGNQIFTFPLGDTTLTSGAYHPLSITAPSNATDAFTGQYYASFSSTDTTVVDSIQMCKTEYWTIARNVGSSNVMATVGWNTNNCLTTNTYDMVVSGWDGTEWKSLEGTNITISGSTGSVKSTITPVWSGTSAVGISLARKKAIDITAQVREPYCVSGRAFLFSASTLERSRSPNLPFTLRFSAFSERKPSVYRRYKFFNCQ